jgi:hypothetical protein
MEYLIGVALAVAVCRFATLVGFDRDRVFYPTLVPVVASYYILFAVMGGSTPALAWESVIAGAFFALGVAGFKTNLWLTVAALAGHGVFDFFHHRLIRNPGVPMWWPGFCLAFDVPAGAFLAILLIRRSGFATASNAREYVAAAQSSENQATQITGTGASKSIGERHGLSTSKVLKAP